MPNTPLSQEGLVSRIQECLSSPSAEFVVQSQGSSMWPLAPLPQIRIPPNIDEEIWAHTPLGVYFGIGRVIEQRHYTPNPGPGERLATDNGSGFLFVSCLVEKAFDSHSSYDYGAHISQIARRLNESEYAASLMTLFLTSITLPPKKFESLTVILMYTGIIDGVDVSSMTKNPAGYLQEKFPDRPSGLSTT